AWKGARARCGNPKSIGYKNYGGRGISVCSEWANSFERFLSDMGEKPSASHSLDRIDPDGNYEPGNCRWATPETQARNKRSFKSKTGVKGVHPMPDESKFKATITVRDRAVHIGVFSSIEEAEAARKAAEIDLWGGECDERG
ncbi:MAG: AP2 domain-containing protein, partial [Marinobacter sp.]